MFLKLRPKPNIRRVLRKLELKIGRSEYEYLCDCNSIIVNTSPVHPKKRLEDGVNVIEVIHNGHSAKFWVEVYRKKVIRAYIM
ncbi:hypothetical protein ACE41F_26810 [Bacillus cereus]|uniref:hypothetical protein n=1 Tax=Bacillus cereus TaxID=1396 RepID=UPI0035C96365